MIFQDTFQDAGDVISFAVVVGSLAEVLPPIAALLAIIWTTIRIYDRIVHGVSK